MTKLGELVAQIRLRDRTSSGVDSAEGRIGEMFKRMGVAAAAVGVALARGVIDAIEDVEQRLNALEERLGRTSETEKLLAEDLTKLGFSDDAVTAGVGVARSFAGEYAHIAGSLDARDQRFGGGAELARDVAALETAGINTRFVPQLARALGIEDPGVLSDQLNAAFDVATRSGSEPEEILTEILDNTEVYAAFGSIPQAAAYVGRQPLIPSETTIQLEQGALVPEQTDVDADVEALSVISPSFGERSEGRLRTKPGLAAVAGAIRAVPYAGDQVADIGVSAGARLGELITGEGNRTQPEQLETFNVPVADLLLELGTRDAAAAERVGRIANRIDLDRRRGGGALDIPG